MRGPVSPVTSIVTFTAKAMAHIRLSTFFATLFLSLPLTILCSLPIPSLGPYRIVCLSPSPASLSAPKHCARFLQQSFYTYALDSPSDKLKRAYYTPTLLRMMCSLSCRPTFAEFQDEVIGKLLSIMDSKHILEHVKVREKIGWGNLIYLLDAIKDFPQEVLAERIQIISAKGQWESS
jgi:hypothetical protein